MATNGTLEIVKRDSLDRGLKVTHYRCELMLNGELRATTPWTLSMAEAEKDHAEVMSKFAVTGTQAGRVGG